MSVDFDQNIVIDIPKIQIPIRYFQKRGDAYEHNQSEAQKSHCCIAEIKVLSLDTSLNPRMNDLFFIPTHYTLSEFVSFYSAYTF